MASLFTLPTQVDLSRGLKHLYLKPRLIPFNRWLIYTGFFLVINVLNNKAFGYKISVPLHIILRSAGPVATMAVGYFSGRHYDKMKILAVVLLFLGVVQAAIADAKAQGAKMQITSSVGSSTSEFLIGFCILFLAMMLSAILGVFTDRTYAKFGRGHTNENLFYSHTLSLPFFVSLLPELRSQGQALLLSPGTTTLIYASSPTGAYHWFHKAMAKTPVQVVFLLTNALTQYLCIKGVNQLSARTSSLTVTIVLNIRKLVSLLLSTYLFGNRLTPGVLLGAVIVFLGGALYALPPRPRQQHISTARLKKET